MSRAALGADAGKVRPWARSIEWALMLIGALSVVWASVQDIALLSPPVAAAPAPAVEVTVTATVSVPNPTATVPAPTTTPEPLATAIAGVSQAQPTPLPASPSPNGRLTILLMGIDQRPDQAAAQGDPGRTDTMLLVSIDFDVHTARLVSIPRDGFVVIPDHGQERINAAYTFGEHDQRGAGPALAKRTVAQLFGIPVDRYALIDIHSMEQIIDTLGGLWIDNPSRLVDTQYPTDDYRTITIDIAAGRQHMDGVTAVEYARTRHPDSDYGRQGRQQQVLLAIRDQALQLQTLPRLPRLISQLANLVQTDLSPVEIGQLISFGRGLNAARDIVSLPPNQQLTPSVTGPGGAAYVTLGPAYRAAVRQLILSPTGA
jgi:LCP family protein required for cell wall assembly